ncbi:MAG: RNA polymerase sigma factor [Planctomycetota bacterium]|jgi:RNA polymerase sigma-70 factor (ECF subfamily)
MEDKLLIWKFKHGSSDALCRIYEKYEDYMLTSAVSLLNDLGSAEDVVHDGNLKGYLTTCVVNLARDKIRAKQRHSLALDKVNPVKSDVESPSDSIVGDEELQRLSKAMAQLPTEQREAIVLHLRGGMTFKAIAKSQHVSINTIQSRYRYGLDKLRSLLDSEVNK